MLKHVLHLTEYFRRNKILLIKYTWWSLWNKWNLKRKSGHILKKRIWIEIKKNSLLIFTTEYFWTFSLSLGLNTEQPSFVRRPWPSSNLFRIGSFAARRHSFGTSKLILAERQFIYSFELRLQTVQVPVKHSHITQ